MPFSIKVVLLINSGSEIIDHSLLIKSFSGAFSLMEMVAVVESDYPVSLFPASEDTIFQWSYSSTAFSDVKMLSMKLFHVSQSL